MFILRANHAVVFDADRIYATLLGRQDINYTTPLQAQEIRESHRDPIKDIDLYRLFHGRNLEYLESIKLQQAQLKQKQSEAEIKHEELLATIKRQSKRKRKTIRSRSKDHPTMGEISLVQPTQIEQVTPKAKIEVQSKPKWSLTAQQNEEAMDQEVDDLLDFVEELQIDDFLEDLEMQQKLASIKDRIEELQREQKALNACKVRIEENIDEREKTKQQQDEDGQEGSTESDPERGEKKVAVSGEGKTALTMDVKHIEPERDAPCAEPTHSEIAKDVLSTHVDMKSVHSKQSIVSILSQSQNIRQRRIGAIMQQQEGDYFDAENNEPKQYTICERLPPLKVRQQLNGSDINNLPYLYRHPGV